MARPQNKPDHFLVALPQTNLRLKGAKIPVTVVAISNGNRLGLQATLPDQKDPDAKPYQQKISLGVPANMDGLEFAEAEARIVGGLLAKKQFSWDLYRKKKPPEKPNYLYVEDAIAAFKENYFRCNVRDERSLSTWRTNYEDVFKKLISPQKSANKKRKPTGEFEQKTEEQTTTKTRLTVKGILAVIDTTEPGTRSRQRDCFALGALARFLNLDLGVDLKQFEGNYSPKPRRIPSDEEIVKGHFKLPLKWQPVHGLMATYGLRPYEVPYADTTDLDKGGYTISLTLSKSRKKKAKTRRIYPYHREWIELFELRNAQLPQMAGRNSQERGGKVSKAFREAGLEYVPYDLRHAWAIRLIGYGVPVNLAAHQMDHSVKIHQETYEAWIPDKFNDRMFELSYDNSQRPKPPQVDVSQETPTAEDEEQGE